MSRIRTTSGSRKVRHGGRGFSLIEMLLVVAMMAVLTPIIAPFVTDSLQRRNLGSYSAEAVDAIRQAQSEVMSGKNNAKYGVHFQSDRFVFFQGATYNSADTTNVIHLLRDNVTATSVTLSPGGSCTLPAGSGNCDILFADRRGIPTQTGSVVLTEGGTSNAKTVTVNSAGMTDEN